MVVVCYGFQQCKPECVIIVYRHLCNVAGILRNVPVLYLSPLNRDTSCNIIYKINVTCVLEMNE